MVHLVVFNLCFEGDNKIGGQLFEEKSEIPMGMGVVLGYKWEWVGMGIEGWEKVGMGTQCWNGNRWEWEMGIIR